jgi:hypothetical protein
MENWIKKVNQLFKVANLHPDTSTKKYDFLQEFYERFLENGWYQHCIHGDGIELIDVLLDRDNLPNAPTKNKKIKISELFPHLKNNKTFLALFPKLINVRTKGKGVGELFLTLILRNGRFDPSVDLQLGNDSWEVKNAKTGGCIKGNENSQFRLVDDLVERYFDGKNPFQTKGKDSRVVWDLDTVWNFSRELWPDLSEDQIDDRTEIFLECGENAYLRNQRVGHDLLKSYQEIDEWKGLILIDSEDVIFLSDLEDVEFVDENVKLVVRGKRGGDTNAVGDGYGKIFKTPKTGSWRNNIIRSGVLDCT